MNVPSPRTSSAPSDRVLRAMTEDGAFRVMTIRATDTVRAVVAAQEASGITAVQLGELVTSAVLVRETMAPGQRVQILLGDAADNTIVGDAFPDGRTRGLVRVADPMLGVRADQGGFLQVMRSLPGRAPHQGVLDVDPNGGIGVGLRGYLARSEQVEAMADVGCVVGEDGVLAAGGYIIQHLPELTPPVLAAMQQRLGAFGELAPKLVVDDDPQQLLDALLGDSPYSRLADSPVQFGCGCGADKALTAVAALGEQDLRELLASGEVLKVKCDYCRSVYEAGPSDYRKILDG